VAGLGEAALPETIRLPAEAAVVAVAVAAEAEEERVEGGAAGPALEGAERGLDACSAVRIGLPTAPPAASLAAGLRRGLDAGGLSAARVLRKG